MIKKSASHYRKNKEVVMKKKFLFRILICSIFFPMSYGHAADSCDQIPGQWFGNWSVFAYRCPVKGEGIRDGVDVYFNFSLYNCGSLTQNFAMTGKCHDGKILLSNTNAVMTGVVTDKQITIQGNNQQASLSKF